MEQFIFDDINNIQKDQNKPTYCDLLQDDLYVAQFLNVNELNLLLSQEIPEEFVVKQIEPESINEVSQIKNQSIQVERQNKKRSTFHNFQKHLITTIRSIINTSKFGIDSEIGACQKKLWKIFMNSNKINKTLITMVVGNLNLQNTSKIIQYGFKDILRQFKPHVIEQAQRNIYYQVLQQLKQADLSNSLTGRRMKNKKQFIVYFTAFLEELTNNQLQKRMAKCTKLLKQKEDL